MAARPATRKSLSAPSAATRSSPWPAACQSCRWPARQARACISAPVRCGTCGNRASRSSPRIGDGRDRLVDAGVGKLFRVRTVRNENLVPRRGLEPPLLAEHGPEPCASTNSAIWAGAADLSGPHAAVNAQSKPKCRVETRRRMSGRSRRRLGARERCARSRGDAARDLGTELGTDRDFRAAFDDRRPVTCCHLRISPGWTDYQGRNANLLPGYRKGARPPQSRSSRIASSG